MKIEASTVEAHRFARVRRKGYDPIEVDRVMGRLVATLRSYEEDTGVLEARVQEADNSVDAIRRTFAAAQRTREEMLSEGATQAADMRQNAQQDADELLAHAHAEVESMEFDRDQVVIDAHAEWVNRLAEAEDESFRLLLEAENARSSAVSEKAQILDLNQRVAEARLKEAAEEADRIANEIVGEASREEMLIAERLQHLRAAVREVETKIHDLAAVATPYTEQIAEIIDLTAVGEEHPLAGSGRT
ncbi:MAG: DivIVA domain-containing protein [Actinomycetota bacterium]|nr:DivIVA domain-containing protein [Actinomycetota bacterium]